ncbi:hypothetical protein TWF281_009999 [Arthrobotrys megalospora]
MGSQVGLKLLDLPREIVDEIVGCLPRRDLESLACCSSAANAIAAPVLYRNLSVNFYEAVVPYSEDRPEGCGLDLEKVERVLETPDSRMGLVKEFEVRLVNCEIPRDGMGSLSDHLLIKLILKRFRDGQLDAVRFQHTTLSLTLEFILMHQRNITALDLGCLGVSFRSPELAHKLPPACLVPGQMKLTSLEIREIQPKQGLMVVDLIRLVSPTLQKLRLGDPGHMHRHERQLPEWSWTDATPSVPKIQLPALVQLHIVHASQFTPFILSFLGLIHGCSRLCRVRLSGCLDPYMMTGWLVKTGSGGMESVQICFCRASTEFIPRRCFLGDYEPEDKNVVGIGAGFRSLSMGSVHTVQLTDAFKRDETLPEWVDPGVVRRLWFASQWRRKRWDEDSEDSEDIEDSEGRDPYVMDLFYYLGRGAPLTQKNWPILEELAVSSPRLRNLPLLPSLKILRVNHPHPDEGNAGLVEIQEYVDRLYDFSNLGGYQPPRLRVFVLEGLSSEEYASTYQDVCGEDSDLKYFAVTPVVSGDDDDDGDRGYSAVVTAVTLETASRICGQAGCSSYLLGRERPSPEGFWV